MKPHRNKLKKGNVICESEGEEEIEEVLVVERCQLLESEGYVNYRYCW